jgi:hypothetical protein
MIGFYASLWPTSREDPHEQRDRVHRLAIQEARMTSGQAAADASGRAVGLIGRVRMALGIAPSTTQPDCVACAA